MARGGHWWNEPPWWAWLVIVVSGVFLVVGLPFALQRGAVPQSAADRAPLPSGTNATATATATTTTREPPARRLVVVGDSTSVPPDAPDGGWPALLAERVPDLEVQAASVGDGGYVTTDPAVGQTVGRLVAGTPAVADADVVVLAGSGFDVAGISDQVAAASADAIREVQERAPDAAVVVVGPTWPSSVVPAGVRNNRDVIRAAAEAAGVRFVDPLTEGWLADDPALAGEDGRPTKAGTAFLADQVQPLVEEALAG